MKVREFAIHSIHRRLAEIAHMHTDHKTGRVKVEEIPLCLLEAYLRQNLELIRCLDEFKNLAMVAYEAGDMEWFQRICQATEMLEDDSFIERGEWI